MLANTSDIIHIFIFVIFRTRCIFIDNLL